MGCLGSGQEQGAVQVLRKYLVLDLDPSDKECLGSRTWGLEGLKAGRKECAASCIRK